jgi:hypothetical protein
MPLDIKTLEDSDHLLEVLLQCEDILDSLDIYCYRNWFSGEVVEGPVIKRHWVSVGLLYPVRKMPDPRAALRLMKHGVKVEFTKVRREVDKHDPMVQAEQNEDHEKDKYWMVELKFPRRLLKKITDDLEQYDDDVDTDDVEQAKDSGVDLESSVQNDQEMPGDFVDPSQDQMVQPQQPPAPGGF